jgi:hypothetical protein
VEGIVVRQRGRLDWTYIAEQFAPLVEIKGQPEIMSVLTRLRLGATLERCER